MRARRAAACWTIRSAGIRRAASGWSTSFAAALRCAIAAARIAASKRRSAPGW